MYRGYLVKPIYCCRLIVPWIANTPTTAVQRTGLKGDTTSFGRDRQICVSAATWTSGSWPVIYWAWHRKYASNKDHISYNGLPGTWDSITSYQVVYQGSRLVYPIFRRHVHRRLPNLVYHNYRTWSLPTNVVFVRWAQPNMTNDTKWFYTSKRGRLKMPHAHGFVS